VVAFVIDEDLRLVLQAAEGGGVDDAVAVALEGRTGAAARLGMANTRYANSMGLPNPDHYSSARDLARLTPDLDRAPPADAFAGFAMGPQEPMQALEAELLARFPETLSVHTIRSPRYREWLCEIAPAGVTKWTGVAALAAAWGIRAEEICAVGDDVNDLPMVRAAGLGLAMGNGRPELQAVADHVVGHHDGSGIEDVADLVLARAAQPAEPA
jgi:hydroxymethylpyrimidine pyrophosphatase-like HAD family hydrolase